MPIYEGIIDPGGNILRNRGDFTVVSKQNNLLIVDFDDDVSDAFCLATAWRGDGDIGPSPVTVGPQPTNADHYLFAVEDYYGVSFRLDNDPAKGPGVSDDDSTAGIQTRGWYAWNDLMPPKPDFFHIVGEVQVPNPGVIPFLTYREPQGTNPAHILLDLHLRQLPGNWPQVFTWKDVRYDRILTGGDKYTLAEIFHRNQSVAQVKVNDVS